MSTVLIACCGLQYSMAFSDAPSPSQYQSTPRPKRQLPRPRVPLQRYRVVSANDVVETAQLDKVHYSNRETIMIRFSVSNRTSLRLGFFAIPQEYARLRLYDSGGAPVKVDRRIIQLEAISRIPARAIGAGQTVTTPWYPISLWGLDAHEQGAYSILVVPSVRPTNAEIRSEADGASATMVDRVLRFSRV